MNVFGKNLKFFGIIKLVLCDVYARYCVMVILDKDRRRGDRKYQLRHEPSSSYRERVKKMTYDVVCQRDWLLHQTWTKSGYLCYGLWKTSKVLRRSSVIICQTRVRCLTETLRVRDIILDPKPKIGDIARKTEPLTSKKKRGFWYWLYYGGL